MFLDKLKNRYSYNFLAVCGWLEFIFLCSKFSPDIFRQQAYFPRFLIFSAIILINIVFLLITFFIYVFEITSLKRITNEKFLNFKFLKLFQVIGVVFAFLPIILFLFAYLANLIMTKFWVDGSKHFCLGIYTYK